MNVDCVNCGCGMERTEKEVEVLEPICNECLRQLNDESLLDYVDVYRDVEVPQYVDPDEDI